MLDTKINLKKFLLDLIFPNHCLGCNLEGVILCERCQGQLPMNRKFNCPFCKQPSFLGNICFSCRRHSHLDGVWIASNYQNELLKKCIKVFKYNLVTDLAAPLADLLNGYLAYIKDLSPAALDFDLIIPVPLHRRKILERGFNQSEILAKSVSQKYGWQLIVDVFQRQRFTRSQVKLDINERKDNIKDAFKINDKEKVKGRKILLIDDVITTGSTLNECAKVLKAAGADKVWALVLAQG